MKGFRIVLYIWADLGNQRAFLWRKWRWANTTLSHTEFIEVWLKGCTMDSCLRRSEVRDVLRMR